MPCYLFTFHTYGSWLPDRSGGYVRRGRGILTTDPELGALYRRLMTQGTVTFREECQLTAIAACLEAARHIECRAHSVATDNQHIHLLVSWRDETRPWKPLRTSFKKAITIKLKSTYDLQKWLSRDASRRQVKDRSHFDYLVNAYLPKHRGWKWDERVGCFQSIAELRRKRPDEA